MQTASTPDQVRGMLSLKIALPGLPALVRPGGLGRRLIGGVRGTESRIAGTRLHEALLECLEPARPAVVLILNDQTPGIGFRDRKSTRLNSSHSSISYAVFCLKKKKKQKKIISIFKKKKKRREDIM